jgi:hypothetical protein
MRGCIMRRGRSSWAVIVYLGRDPQTGREKRLWRSFRTRKEAEAHLAHIVAGLQSGTWVPPSKVRLGDFLEQWLRDYAAGAVRPTTLAGYDMVVRVHLCPALGHIPLSRLSPQAIQGYITSKLQEGLSPTTVRHHIMLLHKPSTARSAGGCGPATPQTSWTVRASGRHAPPCSMKSRCGCFWPRRSGPAGSIRCT